MDLDATSPRRKRRRIWKILLAVLILFAISGAIFVYVATYGFSPGGIPPTYNAVDGDWRLTRLARTGVPLITAINAYRAAHGVFPSTVDELKQYLPVSSTISSAESNQVDGWIYWADGKGEECLISRRLGWDPSLEYKWNGPSSQWVFEPGDGSPPKVIKLDP